MFCTASPEAPLARLSSAEPLRRLLAAIFNNFVLDHLPFIEGTQDRVGGTELNHFASSGVRLKSTPIVDRIVIRQVIDALYDGPSLILAPDERSLQVDLVRLDRTVPVEGCVGSRDPCPSTPTQCAAAQIPEAIGVRQR
jgi:hypothetical protein